MRKRRAQIVRLPAVFLIVGLVATLSTGTSNACDDRSCVSKSDEWAYGEPLLKVRSDGTGLDFVLRSNAARGADEAGAVFRGLLYADPVGVSSWTELVLSEWVAKELISLNEDGSIDFEGLDQKTLDDLNARLRYELTAYDCTIIPCEDMAIQASFSWP